MELTLEQKHNVITIQTTCPTVVQPGNDVVVRLRIHTLSTVKVISLTWNTPASLTPETQVVSFPLSLTANAAQELVQTFHTNNSGEEFGEIEVTIEYIVDLRPKVQSCHGDIGYPFSGVSLRMIRRGLQDGRKR